MDTATLAGTTAGTAFDVMVRAAVPTRFRVRDRWVIAGSFASEAVARREYASLAREFPAETVSLMLVRCEADEASGNFRERVLEKRENRDDGPHRRLLRPEPGPRARARGRTAAPQAAPPPRRAERASGMHWQIAAGLVAATLLLAWLLR